MTAEIVLLNSYAVAMAADSAIMASDKIYQSANKIFALSDSHPVGVMYYQDVAFMGVPWETIIKMFRKTVPADGFETIGGYAEYFRDFLLDNVLINNAESRQAHTIGVLRGCWSTLALAVDRQLKLGDVRADTNASRKIIKATLAAEEERLSAAHGKVSGHSSQYRQVKSSHGDLVVIAANAFLKDSYGRDLPRTLHPMLLRIATSHLFNASTLPGPLSGSGIVLAGFGEHQVFPQVVHLEIEGIPFDSTLVYVERASHVATSGEAALLPFAQDDAAMSFITGIDPGLDLQYSNAIRATAQQVVTKMTDFLKGVTPPTSGMTPDQMWNPVEAMLQNQAGTIAEDLSGELSRWIFENRVSPMRDVVRHLQKDELAETAEAIINLTKLTRRLSKARESVGGPIDVAIISKGDGFIWTRRKHYFRAEENFGYFRSQLGSVLAKVPPVE